MIIKNFHESLKITWNVDNDGNHVSKLMQPETHTVINGKITLIQIPDEFYRLNIPGYTEITDYETLLNLTNFRVNYENGLVQFHSSTEAKQITVQAYYGRGVILTPASRIYSKVNEAGDVVQTLQDIIDAGETALESLGDLDTAINAAVELKDNLESDIETGQLLRNELDGKMIEVVNISASLNSGIDQSNIAKAELDESIEQASQQKLELESSVIASQNIKAGLDECITIATESKSSLDSSIVGGSTLKSELEAANSTASDNLAQLNNTIVSGNSLNISLEEDLDIAIQSKEALDLSIDESNTANTVLSSTISSAAELQVDLNAIASTADSLKSGLSDAIATGGPLKVDLNAAISSAATISLTLNGDITEGQNKIEEIDTKLNEASSKMIEVETARQTMIETNNALRVMEPFDAEASYNLLNRVYYNGSTYECKLQCQGILPTDDTYWQLIAAKGVDGAGSVSEVRAKDSDVIVEFGTTNPTISLNAGTGAGQLLKLDSNGKISSDLVSDFSTYTHPNHFGDVASIADGATTIVENTVTNIKLADMETSTIKGRMTSGKGDPEDLSPEQIRTMLNVAAGANNYVHPSAHPASMITQDINNRFVTDTQIGLWNSKAESSHEHLSTDLPTVNEINRKTMTTSLTAAGYYAFAQTQTNPLEYSGVFKITVKSTVNVNIGHVLYVKVGGFANSTPILQVDSKTNHSTAQDSGLYYLRGVYPKIVNNGKRSMLELYVYDATQRDIQIELLDANNIELLENSIPTAYNASNQSFTNQAVFYDGVITNGSFHGALEGTAHQSISLYHSNYPAGENLKADDIVFLQTDGKWYKVEPVGRNIPLGTIIARCNDVYASGAIVGVNTQGIFALPAGVTGSVGKSLFVRGQVSGNSFIADGVITSAWTNGYSFMRLGSVVASSSALLYDENNKIYTISNDSLSALDGLKINADKLGGLTAGDYVTQTQIDAADFGDMYINVYDTNGDGKVNSAETADSVPWSGITSKPSTFAPSAHNHDALYMGKGPVTWNQLKGV